MKLNIKIKKLNQDIDVSLNDKGDWIDLRAAKDIHLECPKSDLLRQHNNKKYRIVWFEHCFVPLGISCKLPKGFEAIIVPRSSSFMWHFFIQTNSIGVIDNTYCGNDDEWKLPVIALSDCKINKGDRICQFRIQLSQKATLWQKLKWLFSSGVKITVVDDLNSNNRGGFGSTGKN